MSQSTASYTCKDGDTPTIEETVVDRSGTAISLPPGATVSFVYWQIAPVEGVATSSSGTLVDATGGVVSYTLTTAQTALTADQDGPDEYAWEFRVTSAGFQLTAPSEGRGRLTVNPAGDT